MELPVTTFWPSNVSVDAPTTASIYMTTIPVSPPTYTYKVTENSIACLIIEGRFQLIVSYMKWDNGIAKKIVDVPESSNVRVTGSCADEQDITSSLTITTEHAEIRSLTFNFQIIEGISYLVSLSAEVNVKMFPDVMLNPYPKCRYRTESI
ncbi:uncharacterized protein LOC134257521 [Saccostrea cucullata]|uniref:uncharacterized protein LOC134257521 n=1 Tax=Saccostrea cuccullata TaxID=36930 RepID=UPI002ED241E1